MGEPQVFIFWDNSNIFISAKYLARQFGEAARENDIPIEFSNLFHLAHAGRPVGRALAVGSAPRELRQVWKCLRDVGFEVEVFERGARSNTEQGVDAVLQVEMLRTLNDQAVPGVAVLLTGDGAGYEDGVGFHADLRRMADKGWGIEVIAWESSCKHSLRTWASEVGVFVPLERYYYQVTFVQGGRLAQPLSLTHRPLAQPRLRPAPAPPDVLDPVKQRRRKKARLRSQRASATTARRKKRRRK